jgi:hypothetical protein
MKITPRQAALRASVSISMIYQWCQERLLPHYRCGAKGRRGKILIEDTDLEAFLAGCKVAAEQASAPAPGPMPVKPSRPLELKHVKINCERSPPGV